MGKRQHQKDKMYLTYTEWTTLYGGKKAGHQPTTEEENFRRLPYDHCGVSLQPFEHPYCDSDGNIFDLQPLILFTKKFKVNPVTGKAIDVKSLLKLKFFKNNEGEYHCPVLFKVFTRNSHIVAVRTTGNVFSFEAIEQLNIKNKNWKDLINDTPFERKDLIIIQDPQNLNKFNISSFHHVKNNLRVLSEEEIAEQSDPTARLKSVNPETQYTLEQLNKEYKTSSIQLSNASAQDAQKVVPKADKFNAAHYSTGAVGASFTSTTMTPELVHQAAIVHEDIVRYERVKKKGYVRLVTNFGPMNLELHCDLVPKTCENFLKHSQNGFYDGTKFHRSIRNFMIQGGDPTGTGTGGKSIWDGQFEDEFKSNLSHDGRGVLSMANSGKNTNTSQFFITYRSCKHLDKKHTVFGKLVGGMDTLTEVERVEVDNKDRPIEDIVILKAQVFVDPYEEADEILTKERADEITRIEQEALEKRQKAQGNTKTNKLTVFRSGVGKYMDLGAVKRSSNDLEPTTKTADDSSATKTKKSKNYKFNFTSW